MYKNTKNVIFKILNVAIYALFWGKFSNFWKCACVKKNWQIWCLPPYLPRSPNLPVSSESPNLKGPPDPPDSTDPSKSIQVNRISKFIRFTISVRSNRFVQITKITGIQQVLNNCSSLISVCGFVITTLEGLKEYNDFNNVTMAHEDDTWGETDKIILASSSLKLIHNLNKKVKVRLNRQLKKWSTAEKRDPSLHM